MNREELRAQVQALLDDVHRRDKAEEGCWDERCERDGERYALEEVLKIIEGSAE